MHSRFVLATVAAVALSSSLASAQTNLNDPLGFLWDIRETNWGEMLNGTSDAYDSWPQLCVTTNLATVGNCPSFQTFDANGVAGTLELNGRQVVTTTLTISGLQVTRKIYVPDTGMLGYARYLNILDNPGMVAVTVKVLIGSVDNSFANLGSDSSTVLAATSDGTGMLGANLQWFTTDDFNGSGDPSLGHVMAGVNAPIPVSAARQFASGGGADAFNWDYVVTVPAGGRIIIMHFETQQSTQAAANATNAILSDPFANPEIISGVALDELGAIVNFSAGTDLEPGSFCLDSTQCLSGFCIDGVCCDNECGGGNNDCMACSVAAGAALDGVCGVAAADTECRASASVCDEAEVCDGLNMACPLDSVAPAGIECREATAPCDGIEYCDGVSPDCPPDVVATTDTMCRPRTTTCDAIEYCDGVTLECPPDALEPTGTECRWSGDECDMPEVCDGVSPDCPFDLAQPDGFPCGDDEICNGEDTCRAGMCQTAVPPPNCCTADNQCDDGNECTTDSCDLTVNSCLSVPNTLCDEPPPPPPMETGCCNLGSDHPDSGTLFLLLLVGAFWGRRWMQLPVSGGAAAYR